MKRLLAIFCIIACLCGLCVPAMAAAVDLGGLNSLALVGTGVPGAADWNPGDAAGDFVKASDGVYVKVIAVTAGHAMSFKIAGNDAWDDAYNFGGKEAGVTVALGTQIELDNGGGSKDIALTAAKDCNLKFTVNLNGDVATLVVEETTDAVTGPGTPSTPSTPSAPAGPNSLALVGTGIPGVGEWNPGDPAGDMTKVSNGVYTKVIGCLAGTTMTFKVAGNDAWDDSCNYGSASEGTVVTLGTPVDMISAGDSKDMTLTVAEDCNLKFTVTLGAAGATLLVEKTDEEPGATPDVPSTPDVPEGDKITVYVKFPADWKGARVWAWKEPGPVNATNASWPGDMMLVEGENGWWSVQVPNWITGLLINGNEGSVQTPDIKDFEVGKDLWINALTDPNAPVFSYTEITDIAPPAETDAPTAPPPHATEGLKNNTNNSTENKGGKDMTVLLAVIGSVVIVAIAVVVIVVGKGKKKA